MNKKKHSDFKLKFFVFKFVVKKLSSVVVSFIWKSKGNYK